MGQIDCRESVDIAQKKLLASLLHSRGHAALSNEGKIIEGHLAQPRNGPMSIKLHPSLMNVDNNAVRDWRIEEASEDSIAHQ